MILIVIVVSVAAMAFRSAEGSIAIAVTNPDTTVSPTRVPAASR
jgi:hypothetical protein